jgi:predicted DNA-binding protein (UPF0251 family)
VPRPPNPRRIDLGFETRVFKPAGIPTRDLKVVRLDLDGLEALRLADLEGLYHEAAAEQMGVSRATFGRILSKARARVAETLTEGKALWIGGGPVIEGDGEKLPCPLHWGGRRRGRGCRCRGTRRSDEPTGADRHGRRSEPPEGVTDERNEK